MSGGIGSPSSVRSFSHKASLHDIDVDSIEEDTGSYQSAESPGSLPNVNRGAPQRRQSASSGTGVGGRASTPGGGGGGAGPSSGPSHQGGASFERARVCQSDDDDTGLGAGGGKSSEDEGDLASPWSEIISKYLKGTTKGQILEYGKLIRPHTCHNGNGRQCKFKRATRAYRLCYKHQRPSYECRSHRRSKQPQNQQQQQPPQQFSNASTTTATTAVMANLSQPILTTVAPTTTFLATPTASAVPLDALTAMTKSSSHTTESMMAAAAAAQPVLVAFPASSYSPTVTTAAGIRSGLPYPPLYCPDSGFWTDTSNAPAVPPGLTSSGLSSGTAGLTTAAAGLSLSHLAAGPPGQAYAAYPAAAYLTPAAIHQAAAAAAAAASPPPQAYFPPGSQVSSSGGGGGGGGSGSSQPQHHPLMHQPLRRDSPAAMTSNKMGYLLAPSTFSQHQYPQSSPHQQLVSSTTSGTVPSTSLAIVAGASSMKRSQLQPRQSASYMAVPKQNMQQVSPVPQMSSQHQLNTNPAPTPAHLLQQQQQQQPQQQQLQQMVTPSEMPESAGSGDALIDEYMDAAEASAIMEVLFQQVPDIEEQVAAATAAAVSEENGDMMSQDLQGKSDNKSQ